MLRRQSMSTWVICGVAFAIWAVSALIFTANNQRSVTSVYQDAAEGFVAGEHLYNNSGHGFLYPPQSAIVYVPFAFLPEPWGDHVWRAVSLALLVFALMRFRELFPSGHPSMILHLAFSPLVLCAGCVRIGQATVIMTALMVLAITAIGQRRWTTATVWFVLSFAFKPLSLILAALAGIVAVAFLHLKGRRRRVV